LPRTGRDILLAIDLSGSMQIPDMEMNNRPMDRLTIVKSVAKQFIQDRRGDRLGLILFGSRAFLQTPLTFDLQTVKHMLLDTTVGLAGTQTAIGDAIGMAIKHFKNYPKDNKVLILLTDGVNNEGSVSPLEAAKIAAKYGIRIYTVGLGSNQVVVPSLLGPQILTGGDYELDEETLKQIAETTRGIYFHASNPEELKNVYHHLNQIEPRASEKEIFRPKTPLYYWPLGLAFVLCLSMLITIIVRGRRG
jgi:Ca-activated chloride channel family protein